jgi:hypothetical protein
MDIELLTKACGDACKAGVESERNRWVAKIQGLICFDHDSKGCDHSECYTLENILSDMAPLTCAKCDGEGVIDEGDVDGVATVSTCSECAA